MRIDNCAVASSFELLRLLEPLDEVLAPLLSIDLEEVGVEVSRVSRKRIIAPQTVVLIVDSTNEGLVMFLTVHLELFRERSLDGRLQEINLVTWVRIIIKNLPLLDSALVHRHLALADALSSDDILNPVLVLTNELTHAPVIRDARVILIVTTNEESHMVIFLIKVPVGVGVVTVRNPQTLCLALLFVPDLLKATLGAELTALTVVHEL